MSGKPAALDLAAIIGLGESAVREAGHADAIAALERSPVAALLEAVHALQAVLLSANPKALRARVGWIGRLLGRDLVLAAEGQALRERLRVLVHDAEARLADFSRFDAGVAVHEQRLLAVVDALGHAIEELDRLHHDAVPEAIADAIARRRMHLLTLQQAWRITAAQLALTRHNHRQLAQRLQPLLPRVRVLLEQERGLQAARDDAASLHAAHHALDAANAALAGYSPTHPATPEQAP